MKRNSSESGMRRVELLSKLLELFLCMKIFQQERWVKEERKNCLRVYKVECINFPDFWMPQSGNFF